MEEYKPAFSLSAEGKDITGLVSEDLIEIKLIDYGGNEAKADELQISLVSEILELPPKGAKLRFGLGFEGNIVDKGIFTVSGCSSGGPPRIVQIVATAAPFNGNKHGYSVDSQKTRSWDSVTINDIVSTIAQQSGLKPSVSASLQKVKIDHLDQIRESDAAFLTRLARLYNAMSKPTNGYWTFLERDTGKSASGKPLTVVVLKKADKSSWSYSDGARGASNGTAKKKDKKISVAYFDDLSGETKSIEIEHSGPDKSSPFTESGADKAKVRVKSSQEGAERAEKSMNVTMPADPTLLPISAEYIAETEGFGKAEDRAWTIAKIEYSFTQSGFTVAFDLGNNNKKTKAKKDKKDKKGPAYFD